MTDLLPPYHKPMTSQLDCDLANDRIAALEEAVRERDGELRELTRELEKERETSRLRLHYQQEAERERDERLTLEESATLARKVDEAEASLAAERERRCDECESREGSSHYCLLWTINTPDEHYCRDWTARDSGGGAS